MQSQITRSTVRLSRQAGLRQCAPTKRSYAQQAPDAKPAPAPSSVSAGRQNRIPLIAAVSLAAFIPTYYFLQSTIGTGNKAPGSGKAEILDARRKNGTQDERRDPRDSGRKTTEADGPKRLS